MQGNTHLFWDPERPDIRAVQSHAAVSALRAFCQQLPAREVGSMAFPLLCCVVL